MAVLEVGSNHFGEVAYLSRICQPNIGIITNIGPSHLEYLRNLKGVLQEKYALIENLSPPYVAVLNADAPLLKSKVLRKSREPFILGFGIKNKCDFFAGEIKNTWERWDFLVNLRNRIILNTPGYHNIYNTLAAIAVARIFGIGYKDIAVTLDNFRFLKGRLKVIKLKGIRFIDDTYNANPFSLRQALNVLDNLKTKGRKIFVMGDMLELGKQGKSFHCQAGRDAARVCDLLITVGNLSRFAAQAALVSGLAGENIFSCDSSKEAREILWQGVCLQKEDTVLAKGSRAMQMEEVF